MKFKLTGIFLAASILVFAIGDEMDSTALRTEYYYCVSNPTKTDVLYNRLLLMNSDKAIITGYIGALEALKAKHAWNPYAKLDYLDKAEVTFAKAIASDPQNIEIRFLRYTVEYYVPAFLGYGDHIAEDKRVIIQNIKACKYSKNDKFLIGHIIHFFEEKKECTAADLTLMYLALKQCTPTY
jgi:NADH:ubiquinone oxidoreductase subunit F (NADH-binding)